MKLGAIAKQDGDSAFHMIFGKFNGTEYVCDNVQAFRTKVARAIRKVLPISTPPDPIISKIEFAIQELIRATTTNRPLLDTNDFPGIGSLQQKYDPKNENFGHLNDKIIKEYAKFITLPAIPLRHCDLEIIAYAHKIHIKITKESGEEIKSFPYSLVGQCIAEIYVKNDGYYKRELNVVPTGPFTLQKAEYYDGRGLKDTLHGNVYQLKLLMLFLYRGYKANYAFHLGTEVGAAGKFDDVVFRYREDENQPYTYQYIQAKHKRNETGKELITAGKLLTKKDGDFSLQKYFISFQRLKPSFIDGELREFCICTNIGFDFNKTKKYFIEKMVNGKKGKEAIDIDLKNFFELKEPDRISQTLPSAVRYQFKRDENDKFTFPGIEELYAVIKESSSLIQLAKALKGCVEGGKGLNKRLFDKADFKWLVEQGIVEDADKLIDRKLMKGFNDPRNLNLNLSSEAAYFRELYFASDKIQDKEITNDEIDDFLRHLVFAVNQPDEVMLGKIIEQELSELSRELNLIDSKFIYAELLNHTLAWMKEKEGYYLTPVNFKAFLKEVKQEIHRLALIGPTLAYQTKLRDFGVTFTPCPIIQAFLNGPDRLMIYQVTNLRLASIQVYQTVEQRSINYTFIRLKTALCLRDILEGGAKSEKNKLLIFSCDVETTEEVKTLLTSLLKGLAPEQQVILLTSEGESLEELINCPVTPAPPINFESLAKPSQDKLQEYKVDFQGREIGLTELIVDLQDIIDTVVLDELIEFEKRRKKLVIDRPIFEEDKKDEFEKIYIERKFSQDTVISKLCLQKNTNDIYVISGKIDKASLQNTVGQAGTVRFFDEKENDESKPSRYIILNSSDPLSTQFEEIILLYPAHSVHWLQWDGACFVWQKTHGSLANLQSNRQTVNDRLLQDKHIVLSAQAGMGKSTDWLAFAQKLKEEQPNLWVINLSLLKIEDRLKKAEFIDLESVVDFFMQNETTLAKKIFNRRLTHRGEVAVLLDGFDEIQATVQPKVVELLQLLKQTEIKHVFITSRPHMQEQLENALSTFAYTLNPFSDEDRYQFFANFWQIALKLTAINHEKVVAYASKLIEVFKHSTNDKKDKFIGIPLQVEMLATAFLDDFSTFYTEDSVEPALPKKLPLYALYQRFIKAKYRVLVREKFRLSDVNALATFKSSLIESINIQHQLLALEALFPDHTAANSLSMKINAALIAKAGIAYFIKDKSYFTHRTYAEYFAAEFLVRGLQHKSDHSIHQQSKAILIQHIFKARSYVLKEFITEIVNSSDNEALKEIWDNISRHNILPNNAERIEIKASGATRIATERHELNSSLSSRRVEKNEISMLLNHTEQFCKAVLEEIDINIVTESLNFLEGAIKETWSYKAKNIIARYLVEILDHYVRLCGIEGKVFELQLVEKFSDLNYYGSDQHVTNLRNKILRLIKLHEQLSDIFKKHGSESIVQFTTAKLIRPYLIKKIKVYKDKLNFDMLSYIEKIQTTNNAQERTDYKQRLGECKKNRRDSEELYKQIQQASSIKSITPVIEHLFLGKDFHWLENDGIEIVKKTKILTPKIAMQFGKYLDIKEKISGYDTIYAHKIWHVLLLPLLRKKDDLMFTKKISRVAVIKICIDYLQFLERCEGQQSFLTIDSIALQNLLELTGDLLNSPTLNQRNLSFGIAQLYLLNKTGLQIIDAGEDTLLILEPTSEFECTLQLNHKIFIHRLLKYRASDNYSEEEFEKRCNQISVYLARQSVTQQQTLPSSNLQQSVILPKGVKRARSLEGLPLGEVTKRTASEPLPKKVRRETNTVQQTSVQSPTQALNPTSTSSSTSAVQDRVQQPTIQQSQGASKRKREEERITHP